MATDEAGRPESGTPRAEKIELKDLPRSQEELTAAQEEEVTGGAAVTGGAGSCWLAQKPRLDSCWIENNG